MSEAALAVRPDEPPTGKMVGYSLLLIAVVLVGQVGMARELFGSGGLRDDRPIISGQHPLHLYHASLGAASFRERFSTSCYDPAFQAGCLKTPVFDGGCRPAEAFLLLAGKNCPPEVAYKIGLFGICLLTPLVFVLAGLGGGLGPLGTAFAAAAGSLLWWTPPIRALIDAGNVELLLAGQMGLLFVVGMIRYASRPGLLGWLLLSVSAVVGWYAHPVVWLGLLPVLVSYYVFVAPRHGLAWHLGWIGVTIVGLAPNLWWLWDWARFWWLRQPSVDELTPLPNWDYLIGGPKDLSHLLGPSPFGWIIAVAGVVGFLSMLKAGRKVGPGVLALTCLWVALIARLGMTWPTLQVVATERAAPLILGCLTLSTGFIFYRAAHPLSPMIPTLLALVALFAGWGQRSAEPVRAAFGLDLRPLPLGYTEGQLEFAKILQEQTTGEARILLEETDQQRADWNWTALLPTLVDRNFLGGLDPNACVEHAFCQLRSGQMNGRPFIDWTDDERNQFVERYNVGWVVCRTPDALAFWQADPRAREVARFREQDDVVLLAIDRPHTYILEGSATIERADRHAIVLVDAQPNQNGELILSYHYQTGFWVAPRVVGIEPDKDPFDPIPMIKLRLFAPVSRLTLAWENP